MALQVYNNFFIGVESEMSATTMTEGCVFLATDTKNLYGVDLSGDTYFIGGSNLDNISIPTKTSDLTNDGEGILDKDGNTLAYITSDSVIIPASEQLDVSAIWVSDLTFDVTANRYPILDAWYSASATTVTIDPADATLDRIDLIAAKIDGTIEVIYGTPSNTPSPPDWDSSLYYPIKFVLIPATVTTLSSYFTETLIFDEGVGNPTEWDYSFVNSGTTLVNTDANTNTWSLDHTPVSNSFGRIKFSGSTSIESTDIDNISFYLKLKGQYNSSIKLSLYSQGVPSFLLSIKDGQMGFDKTNLAWQKITIPISNNNLSSFKLDQIDIQIGKVGFSGFLLDTVNIVTTSNAPVPTTTEHPSKTSAFENDGDGTGSKYVQEVDLKPLIVHDENAVEQFTVDPKLDEAIQFEGVTFDPVNKRITVNSGTTVVQTSDIINDGSDGTSTYVEHDELSHLALQPPVLSDFIPDTYLPSTTGNFIVKGDFFIPSMVDNINSTTGILVEGHTINYATFINSNEIRINLQTSATEGDYDLTLNNGLQVLFPDVLQVVGGTLYEPISSSDWRSVTSLKVNNKGEARVEVFGSLSTGKWNQILEWDKDWELYFTYNQSPLGVYVGGNNYGSNEIQLKAWSDDTSKINMQFYMNAAKTTAIYRTTESSPIDPATTLESFGIGSLTDSEISDLVGATIFKLRYVSGVLYSYANNVLQTTLTGTFTEDLYLEVNLRYYDLINIKYIDLSDASGTLPDYRDRTSDFINDGADGTSTYVEHDELSNLALQPPILSDFIPENSMLPSTTGNFLIRGDFFIPSMINNINSTSGILIEGHTINYATFISSSEIRVNLETSATVGDYDLTLNNGLQVLFPDVFQVISGTIYIPDNNGMILISGTADLSEAGNIKKNTESSVAEVELPYLVPQGNDFELRWVAKPSPLRANTYSDGTVNVRIIENNVLRYEAKYWYIPNTIRSYQYGAIGGQMSNTGTYITGDSQEFYFQRIGTQMVFKRGTTVLATFTDLSDQGDIKFRINIDEFDIVNVKYIDLSDITGTLPDYRDRLSEFINDGADGTSTYVEHDELATVGLTNSFTDLDNIPLFSEITEPADIRVTPNYALPSTSQDVIIEAKNINDATTVSFGAGVTLNSQKVEVNKFGALVVRANVTHDTTEGPIDVTLNNGIPNTSTNAYSCINGTPYKPIESDWINVTGQIDVSGGDNLVSTSFLQSGNAVWDREFDYTKSWALKWKVKVSPLGDLNGNNGAVEILSLRAVSDDTKFMQVNCQTFVDNYINFQLLSPTETGDIWNSLSPQGDWDANVASTEACVFQIIYDATTQKMTVKFNTATYFASNYIVTENVKVFFDTRRLDFYDITFIDLSTAGTPEAYDDAYAKAIDLKPISIQDESAVEQFTVDPKLDEAIQFEGVTFDAVNKRIVFNGVSLSSENTFTDIQNLQQGIRIAGEGSTTEKNLIIQLDPDTTTNPRFYEYLAQANSMTPGWYAGHKFYMINSAGKQLLMTLDVNGLRVEGDLTVVGSFSQGALNIDIGGTSLIKDVVNTQGVFFQESLVISSPKRIIREHLRASGGSGWHGQREFYIKSNNSTSDILWLRATSNDDSDVLVELFNKVKPDKLDLSALPSYADDTAAGAGGVAIGEGYINSSTGALHRRLT